MKALLGILLTLSVSNAFSATATLSWPTVTECNISSASQDAEGNVIYQCSSSLKLGVPITVRLDEFDHSAGSSPTITGGTCTYTNISTFRVSLGKGVYINVQCAQAVSSFSKYPPGENFKNLAVTILPDGSWGWTTSLVE